jgi:LysR family transcriptional regulator of beta-lactamase
MDRSRLPLTGLRAFEAAARHLNFTRAAAELCVTQAALSHQIKGLETQLGVQLFRRLPRGAALTDEGAVLAPALKAALDRISEALDVVLGEQVREVITLGVVSTFATGWLLPRLGGFARQHPGIELRILTNNNKPELAGEGLSAAIRFGEGAWHGVHATHLMEAPLAVLCAPSHLPRLRQPADVLTEVLLRSYREGEWPSWLSGQGLPVPRLTGPVFDSSLAIARAVMSGVGVGLLPPSMFAEELASQRLAMPFAQTVQTGSYWLTRLQMRPETAGLAAFRVWLCSEAERENASRPRPGGVPGGV